MVVDILNVILTVTDKIIENAKNLNTLLDENQESIVADIETYLAEIGAQVNNLVLKLIDQLKEGTNENGLAVLQCVDGQEETTNIALAETITLAATCLSEKSSDILDLGNLILEHVESIEEKVKAQVETLNACTSSDLICLLAFGDSAVTIGKEIAEIVPADVSTAASVIQEVIDHVAGCKLIDNVKENAQNIFNNVADCVKA